MFGDELTRELFEVVRAQAHAIERLTGKQDGTIGSLRGRTIASLRPRPTRGYVPRDPRFRDWKKVCTYFQDIERRLRRDHQLGPEDRLSREMVCAASGELVPKTLKRLLEHYWGLTADDWPPLTWPENPPKPA